MVDIAKFKDGLIQAKAIQEAENLSAMEHAKDFLEPFFAIAAAAEEVFPGKITWGEMEPDGLALSTSIGIDGKWINFITEPECKTFTIEGLNEELSKVLPPDDRNTGGPFVLTQLKNDRAIDVDLIEQATEAFAAFVEKRLLS
ncbi:hypothetical protein [Vibrio sp.]|uniref:hypothetical protein n=1 Tax=Vibrio sp. TaxID=678 RepID=UPI003AA998B8